MCLVRASFVLLLFMSAATADDVDFENLPSTYMYLGDGQNIGSFYAGVAFGPNVTGLDLSGSTAFPPHSGSIAVWDPFDLTVTISFGTPQSVVGVWYTSFDLLTFAEYNDSNTLLSSVVAPANTDGTTGNSNFVSLTIPNISSVTLTGSPGGYVFDDVTFSGNTTSVPEPASIVLLLSMVVLLSAGYIREAVSQARKAWSTTTAIEVRELLCAAHDIRCSCSFPGSSHWRIRFTVDRFGS
jgi:hypothetical protein